jgi:hypothetical protein
MIPPNDSTPISVYIGYLTHEVTGRMAGVLVEWISGVEVAHKLHDDRSLLSSPLNTSRALRGGLGRIDGH